MDRLSADMQAQKLGASKTVTLIFLCELAASPASRIYVGLTCSKSAQKQSHHSHQYPKLSAKSRGFRDLACTKKATAWFCRRSQVAPAEEQFPSGAC
jgi:hypothetical protein